MDKKHGKKTRHKIANDAELLLQEFQLAAGLMHVPGDRSIGRLLTAELASLLKPVKLRSLKSEQLRAIAKAARQVGSLGEAASAVLANRSAAQKEAWPWQVVRTLSGMWVAGEVARHERIRRLKERGKYQAPRSKKKRMRLAATEAQQAAS